MMMPVIDIQRVTSILLFQCDRINETPGVCTRRFCAFWCQRIVNRMSRQILPERLRFLCRNHEAWFAAGHELPKQKFIAAGGIRFRATLMNIVLQADSQ